MAEVNISTSRKRILTRSKEILNWRRWNVSYLYYQPKFTSFSTNISVYFYTFDISDDRMKKKKRKYYFSSIYPQKKVPLLSQKEPPLWNQVLFPTLPNKNKPPVLGDIHFNFHFREPLSNFPSTIESTSPRVLRRSSAFPRFVQFLIFLNVHSIVPDTKIPPSSLLSVEF